MDLGCGDGTKLRHLVETGHLNLAGLLVGVDLSHRRIENFLGNVPGAIGVVGNATDLGFLKGGSFDLVICQGLLELLPDHREFLRQVHYVLKPQGRVCLLTVLKRPYAWWVYKNKYGEWVTDPDVISPQTSSYGLVQLFEDTGFQVKGLNIELLWFPVVDLWLQLLIRMHCVPSKWAQSDWLYGFRENRFVGTLNRWARIPRVGFYELQVAAVAMH